MSSADEKIHLYIWPERFLYLGPSTRTSLHRNHAATWLIARHGTMRVTLGSGEALENQVIYLPSEIEYATDLASSGIAALYWEPESTSFQRVLEQMENTPRAYACSQTRGDAFARLYDFDTTRDEADHLLLNVFGFALMQPLQPVYTDARVNTALAFLRETPQAYDSIEALSARVHLSPSRFAHLFKKVVGVPVRRYVLWLKMRRALDLAIAGDSLTTAALSAGFADSAHLSRTVRAILGIAPEFLFRQRERLVIHH
ncbi:MAG: AraC family transcriptional regulator [Usitatibacteraceae bacterium]